MTEQDSIVVLLSSYNGEKYIEQQIQSILQQSGVRVRLLIRDDGSTDKTCTILRRVQAQYPQIALTFGKNLGVIRSFFELIRQAATESDVAYFAFADQDDVWHPDKLANAVHRIHQQPIAVPVLYCTAVEYVDVDLNHLKPSPVFSEYKIGFRNALVQNIATGCTIVLNRAAMLKIARGLPERCVMHDWWMYLVISAFGTVIHDPVASMQYRQHSQNVLGVAPSALTKIRRRVARVANAKSTRISDQLREFQRLYGAELSLSYRQCLERMLHCSHSLVGRLTLVFSRDFVRQSVIDDVLIRILILVGKF